MSFMARQCGITTRGLKDHVPEFLILKDVRWIPYTIASQQVQLGWLGRCRGFVGMLDGDVSLRKVFVVSFHFLCVRPCRHLLAVGLESMEGVVYLDESDRKMIVTRSNGLRPQLLSDCHVPLELRFTFYDQVHTTGRSGFSS